MNLQVSVIIPTYNRKKILEQALGSLFDQSCSSETYEVIVVDDGSTDGTARMIKSLSSAGPLRYFWKNKEGPAAARNYGITRAKGEIIIFIDSDLVVSHRFVEEHIASQGNHSGIIVRGLVINTDNPDPRVQARVKLSDISAAFFATGNVSVKKKFLAQAGLFDTDFNEYGWEDLELGERLKKIGLRVMTNKRAVGYHLRKRVTPAQLPRVCAREKERGRMAVIFYRKQPTFKVKLMTHFHPLFFLMDSLLNLGGWSEKKGIRRLFSYLEKNNHHFLSDIILGIISHHAYMQGIREALERVS